MHRWGIFIILATTICFLAWHGTAETAKHEELFRGLPGGMEGMPGFTLFFLHLTGWFARWWWLCLIALAGILEGGHRLLGRSQEGRQFLGKASRTMTLYQPVILALYVVLLFSTMWAHDLAMRLPYIQIMDSLTGP